VAEPLPTLAAALETEAVDLGDAEVVQLAGGAVEWQRDGVAFAALSGDVVEFRLPVPVAAAALRTPGTGPSAKGPGWIGFRPVPVDGHALDRAIAWFGSAWRRVAAER
jgi:hypothetical protein